MLQLPSKKHKHKITIDARQYRQVILFLQSIILPNRIASRWLVGFWNGSRVEAMRATRVILLIALSSMGLAQSLSPNWEELTAEDFIKAVQQAQGTCILPFGIVEKHGPSGPLGTDLINVRSTVAKAVEKEYAIVFPAYYFGQIFEAQHQPGTIAYSSKLQMELLQETASEMARNGCSKIVIVNGHGGNNGLLQYFITTELESPRDYVVYSYQGVGGGNPPDLPEAAKASRPGVDGHAGEVEVATVMAAEPGLGHPDRAGRESGQNLRRVDLPAGVSTAIIGIRCTRTTTLAMPPAPPQPEERRCSNTTARV
jgi:creatinine amidohydrolase